MKTNLIIFSMLLSVFVLSSCKDNDGLIKNIPEGTFSAKIDGKKFKPTIPPAAVYSDVFGGRLFSMTGVSLPGIGKDQILSLIFTGESLDLMADTYVIEGDCDYEEDFCAVLGFENGATGQDEDNFYSAISAGEGATLTVKFLEIDLQPGGKAKGTFSGRLYDEFNEVYHEVTDGKFHLDIVQ